MIIIALGDPVMKRGGFGFPLTGLSPPHLYACPKAGHGFPTSHVVVFLCSE
jgi:hypothetical protein